MSIILVCINNTVHWQCSKGLLYRGTNSNSDDVHSTLQHTTSFAFCGTVLLYCTVLQEVAIRTITLWHTAYSLCSTSVLFQTVQLYYQQQQWIQAIDSTAYDTGHHHPTMGDKLLSSLYTSPPCCTKLCYTLGNIGQGRCRSRTLMCWVFWCWGIYRILKIRRY